MIDMVQYSDGHQGPVLTCKARETSNFLFPKEQKTDYIYMEGQPVFKFAVKKVPECIGTLLEKTGTSKEEIKYYVLHQANSRIIDSVARRMKEPEEKFPMNLHFYGNTSAASIPILLDEMNREACWKEETRSFFPDSAQDLPGALLCWSGKKPGLKIEKGVMKQIFEKLSAICFMTPFEFSHGQQGAVALINIPEI